MKYKIIIFIFVSFFVFAAISAGTASAVVCDPSQLYTSDPEFATPAIPWPTKALPYPNFVVSDLTPLEDGKSVTFLNKSICYDEFGVTSVCRDPNLFSWWPGNVKSLNYTILFHSPMNITLYSTGPYNPKRCMKTDNFSTIPGPGKLPQYKEVSPLE